MSALEDIFSRESFGIKLGLESMRALCRALDHPERAAPCVIVAGTNGKGSVTAMAATMLHAAGWRVGRYTSPHLVTIHERFAVNDAAADPDALEECAARVMAAEQAERARGAIGAPMTFFELTTATAFEYFRRQRVDVALYEVGMGGRFDATNVVSPAVGAITTVDLDHMAYLGDTIGQIAFEKAGIIKPGMPVIVGRLPEDADAVVSRVAKAAGSPVLRALEGVTAAADMDDEGRTRLRLATSSHDYGTVPLALRGLHQVENAVVATRLVEALAHHSDVTTTASAIAAGLMTTRWPGRLDLRRTRGGRTILLDAAHNPAGTEALARYLREARLAPLPVVFGVMRDKDVAPMLCTLAPVASRFVFTEAPTPRARPCHELTAVATSAGVVLPMSAEPDPAAAVRAAWSEGSRACVAGSIFLVGEVVRQLDAGRSLD